MKLSNAYRLNRFEIRIGEESNRIESNWMKTGGNGEHVRFGSATIYFGSKE